MNALLISITLEEAKRFLSVWLFCYVSNFADLRIEVPRYQSSSTSWDHFFFLSQCFQQQWSVRQNFLTSIRSKRLRKKRKETVKPTCFSLLYTTKATSVPRTPQTNLSQYHSPVEALNLIVDSKSKPVELDNSTSELHVPSRRKKSLQSYCSVDSEFLVLMRFNMTFDVTLRDGSSFA